MPVAIAGFLGSLSPVVSLHMSLSVGGHCRVLWVAIARFLGSLSPFCLPSSRFRNPYPWVAIAGFLGSLSPFVSLHLSLFAGGHCRVLWVSMKRRGASGLHVTLSLSAGSKVGVVVVVVGSNRINRSGI